MRTIRRADGPAYSTLPQCHLACTFHHFILRLGSQQSEPHLHLHLTSLFTPSPFSASLPLVTTVFELYVNDISCTPGGGLSQRGVDRMAQHQGAHVRFARTSCHWVPRNSTSLHAPHVLVCVGAHTVSSFAPANCPRCPVDANVKGGEEVPCPRTPKE